jgi:hypothetical protein
LTLRNARYSSAAEISIFIAENRVLRISSALARFERDAKKRRKSARRAEVCRLGMVLKPIWQ